MLDNPVIRRILPGNINEALAEKKDAGDGEPFCNTGVTVAPFEIKKLDEKEGARRFAGYSAIVESSWKGQDYFRSNIPGFRILGSYLNSEKESGLIKLRLKRGESVLFSTGPRVRGQSILVNNSGVTHFNTELPVLLDWSILDFSNSLLPDEFEVIISDAGTQWAEWYAVGLKD